MHKFWRNVERQGMALHELKFDFTWEMIDAIEELALHHIEDRDELGKDAKIALSAVAYWSALLPPRG